MLMKTEVNIKLSTDEIVVMCEKLARRYNRPHMNDDLVSEGVLAVYERLESTPDDYPASLYRRANKAMYDYINVKTKAVNIPKSRTADSIMTGNEYKGQTHSEEGKRVLEEALRSTIVEFDEGFMSSVKDCTEKYEVTDYLRKSLKVLTEKETEIINMRYFKEMTQDEVAVHYDVTRQAVGLWEDKALAKMSKV
jgi:RNA polymerase sigma factor (sigma-70 family)